MKQDTVASIYRYAFGEHSGRVAGLEGAIVFLLWWHLRETEGTTTCLALNYL